MKAIAIIVLVLGVLGLAWFFADQGMFGLRDEAGRHERSTGSVTPEERAWDVLTECLNSHDEELRAETLEIISDLRDDRVSKFLRRSLESDESAIVRLRAAGLEALAGRKDLLAFVKAIAKEEDDYDAYIEAARTYGRIGTPECVPELIRILTVEDDIDSDEDSQIAAARWLARLGARDAIPALRKLLEAEDEEVVFAAAAALLLLGEADVLPKLAEGIEDESESITAVLAAPGIDAGIPVLTKILASDEPFDSERGDAAIALATIGTEAARTALVSAWDALATQSESDPKEFAEVRGYLAAALARLGDDRGLADLISSATGQEYRLAGRALEGIARLGRGMTRKTLAPLLATPEARSTFNRQISRAWAARAILAVKD